MANSRAKSRVVRTGPTSRVARGGPLSEEVVVAAALEIISESGVDGLTMRALSDRLGVALGATYKHVPNKGALLDLVTSDLFAGTEQSDPRDADWRSRMYALFTQIYETFSAYPGLAAQVSQHSPGSRPPHLRRTLVQLLREAGFAEATVEDVMSALFYYTTGALLMTQHRGPDGSAGFAAGLDFLLAGAQERLESERVLLHAR